MSLYQLHRYVFDYLRADEVSSGATPDSYVSAYPTDSERKVFESKDIAALYQMGFHPVLLNGYCRAVKRTCGQRPRRLFRHHHRAASGGQDRW